MAHIIDTMLAVSSQINSITRKYNDRKSCLNCELANPPLFAVLAADRMVRKHRDLVIDCSEEETPVVVSELVARFNTGDAFAPVYTMVVSNINGVIFDQFPLIVNHKEDVGPGIGSLIIIPERIFTDDEEDFYYYISKIFISIYSKLLSKDKNMTYDADEEFFDIIKYSENPKVMIPTYDIEMVVIALACAYINLREMYNDIDASFLVDSIEEELPVDIKNNLVSALNNITSIASLRDYISNGELIAEALGYNQTITIIPDDKK